MNYKLNQKLLTRLRKGHEVAFETDKVASIFAVYGQVNGFHVTHKSAGGVHYVQFSPKAGR